MQPGFRARTMRCLSCFIRICEAQFTQDLDFARFHFLSVTRVLVIKTLRVQHTVHGEVRVVCGGQLALLTRLARDDLGAEDDIGRKRHAAVLERQNVGGVVLVAEVAI